MEEKHFTVVILHKDHDRRSESLNYLLRSLSNIEGNFNVVIVGDAPKKKYANLTVIDSPAETPFMAISNAIKQSPDIFNEDMIIMSDDMIIANLCPISVLIIPKRNAHDEERGEASHCPFYAEKRIFAETDSIPDIPEMKELPLERLINKFLSIDDKLCFPVHYLVGPLLGSFVSQNPEPARMFELFNERYFVHIRDNSFPALRPMLINKFPQPSKYEGAEEDADKQPTTEQPTASAKTGKKGDANPDEGKKSEEGDGKGTPAPDADEKKEEQKVDPAVTDATEQPATPEK